MLATIVNQLPDDTFRRTLTVIAEELYFGIFRDYLFMYDPKTDAGATSSSSKGPRLPAGITGSLSSSQGHQPAHQLNEDKVASGVPYFAVVQSLREAAKDAIMRRLELEAQITCERQAAAEAEAEADLDETLEEEDGSNSGKAEDAPGGSKDESTGQLRASLRNARRLVQTYQARTLELERTRMDMEEEVSRASKEREKEEMLRQELESEVRQLREQLREQEAARNQGSYSEVLGEKRLPKNRRPVEPSVEEEAGRAYAEDPKDQAAERQALQRLQDSPYSEASTRQPYAPRASSVTAGPGGPTASTTSMASMTMSVASSITGGADVAAGSTNKARRGQAGPGSASTLNGSTRSAPGGGGGGVRLSTRMPAPSSAGKPKGFAKKLGGQVPLVAN